MRGGDIVPDEMDKGMAKRSFTNQYSDILELRDVEDVDLQKVKEFEEKLIKHIKENKKQASTSLKSRPDDSVYTGPLGIAIALALLGWTDHAEGANYFRVIPNGGGGGKMRTWRSVCEKQAKRCVELESSLLCGLAGAIFCDILFALVLGHAETCREGILDYLRIRQEENDADEWLYGRTGYCQVHLTSQRVDVLVEKMAS